MFTLCILKSGKKCESQVVKKKWQEYKINYRNVCRKNVFYEKSVQNKNICDRDPLTNMQCHSFQSGRIGNASRNILSISISESENYYSLETKTTKQISVKLGKGGSFIARLPQLTLTVHRIYLAAHLIASFVCS